MCIEHLTATKCASDHCTTVFNTVRDLWELCDEYLLRVGGCGLHSPRECPYVDYLVSYVTSSEECGECGAVERGIPETKAVIVEVQRKEVCPIKERLRDEDEDVVEELPQKVVTTPKKKEEEQGKSPLGGEKRASVQVGKRMAAERTVNHLKAKFEALGKKRK